MQFFIELIYKWIRNQVFPTSKSTFCVDRTRGIFVTWFFHCLEILWGMLDDYTRFKPVMYYFGFYHCCKKNIRRDFQNVVRGYLTFSLVRWDSSAGLQVYCCQPDSSVGLVSVYRLCPSTQHCFVDLEDHITSLDAVPLASSMCMFLSVTTTKTNLSYT